MTCRTHHLFAILLLAGCHPQPQTDSYADEEPSTTTAPINPSAIAPTAEAAAVRPPALALGGAGLQLAVPGEAEPRVLDFGTAQSAVLAALSVRGDPAAGRQEECGAGPLDFADWPDGLRLYFQDGFLAGWALGPDAEDIGLRTVGGVGIGDTLAELKAAYKTVPFPSSLGTEFFAGDLGGLLSGPQADARITNLWAGTSCNFR